MKKLIVILLFPLSVFAQQEKKVKICSNLNYFGRLGRVLSPLICAKDIRTGFSITVFVRELQGDLSYYGLCVTRHGIGTNMDSSRLILTYIDGTTFEMTSFDEKNYEQWSYFDQYGEFYSDFLKKKIKSIKFINLSTNDSYSYELKPEQTSFFKESLDDIIKNKFYVGECN